MRRNDFDNYEYPQYVDLRPKPAQDDIKAWKKKDKEVAKAIVVISMIFFGGYGLLVLMTYIASL